MFNIQATDLGRQCSQKWEARATQYYSFGLFCLKGHFSQKKIPIYRNGGMVTMLLLQN